MPNTNPNVMEASEQFDDWPELVEGKKTQVIVCGIYPKAGGEPVQLYWRGEFDEVAKAQYWASRKEREFKRRGFMGATSVYWQHGMSEQEAVDRIKREVAAR